MLFLLKSGGKKKKKKIKINKPNKQVKKKEIQEKKNSTKRVASITNLNYKHMDEQRQDLFHKARSSFYIEQHHLQMWSLHR